MMGRARPELRADYRSITYGNYVIFLRYSDEEGPRSHLYIGDIIQGNRDLDAYFAQLPDDEDLGAEMFAALQWGFGQ
jgi:plasmid stabilization system protein ParE